MSSGARSQDEGVFPVLRAAAIPQETEANRWLIEELWGASAVGIIGGNPKTCKSWLALEMAVSISTGSKCLGRYQARERGAVLLYLAEDALPVIRARVESIAKHHGAELEALDLYFITTASMRLDLPGDQERLRKTIQTLRPKLVVLDPLVRLHRLDENSANEVSGLLSYLRDLQREHQVALAVVHHTRKNTTVGAQAGQGLRGSGDFHAWSDSSLYLRRVRDELSLTVEHRSASAPKPMGLRLVTQQDGAAHLECTAELGATETQGASLRERLLGALGDDLDVTRSALRDKLAVKNERLGNALSELEKEGLIQRTREGWRRNGESEPPSGVPCSLP